MEGLYLYTFVVKPHDPNLDTSSICKRLFGDSKCLVVLEMKTKADKKNPHTHWHGYSSLKEDAFNDLREELITKHHYLRKLEPKCRPCRKKKGEASELGFQYIMKHDTSSVLYSQGLSDADLVELREQSEVHLDKVKHGMDERMWAYMDKVPKTVKFVDFWNHCKYRYLKMYKEDKKPLPPSSAFKSRLATIMMNWPGATSEFLKSLSKSY